MRPIIQSAMAGWLFASACVFGTGCDEPNDRPSQLQTLRVMAVRADHPFVSPGSQVRLEMLLHDGSPQATQADGSQRAVHVFWMASCLNAKGDLYYECYRDLHAALAGVTDADLAAERVPEGLATGGTLGFGTSFASLVPSDAITSRPQAFGTAYPYGLLHVFFMACAGDIRLLPNSDPDNNPPVGCFRPGADERLTQSDFDFGYYPVYVYDTLVNQNPTISSLTFGTVPPGDACSAASECGGAYTCGSHGVCIPSVPSCAADNAKDCPGYALAPTVDRSSIEPSASTRIRIDSAAPETLWVDYYSTAGRFDKDSRIINDATAGWFDDYEGIWRPHRISSGGEVRLFAVVHDSRGGLNWVFQDVQVR